MPVPNDLSIEDEREFAQHGVESLGEGREPVVESEADIQRREQAEQDDQAPEHGDRRPRRADGTFKSADEIEADRQAASIARKEGREPAQQQQGGDQGQQQGGEDKPKFVPHEALHQERQRSADFARRAQLAETRMNAMLEAQRRGGGQQQEVMPKLDEDPAGYIVALEQRLARFEQANNEQNELRQLDNSIEQDEELFKTQRPDYDRASDYFVHSRAQELLQFYPPEEAQRFLTEEARKIATASWQRGRSAAEAIYSMALARGYNPNLPDREGKAQEGQGQQQQRGSAAAIVRDIRSGQERSRSLSGGGGGGNRTENLNAEALLAMSDEEFEEHLALGTKRGNSNFAAIG